ncbi:hypothetical protein KIM372_17400 [Bombiscardovia nodaiensis]|uniref:Cell surface protein n=1 Tax=Bombiscardovia nodaiensis TaxID=2932181 RepID=A0ABN6SEB3_9BIFI|nr:hypothetical protein KIM372_17400 [Bombiscardovia nodaiensis]
MRLKAIVSAAGASILACMLALALVIGLHPAQAHADEAQSQPDPTLTIHVLDNGSTSGAKGLEAVAEMLPKDAKPVGAGYVYSATRLNYDAIQAVAPNKDKNDNKEVTDKVLAKLTDFTDKVDGKSIIFQGSTDAQGTIAVGSKAEQGVWLQDATYNADKRSLDGGTPAVFTTAGHDCSYWLIQFVGAPKDQVATADAVTVQLPTKMDDGTFNYKVEIYPKVQTKPANDQPTPITPTNPEKPNQPENPKQPDNPTQPKRPVDQPTVPVRQPAAPTVINPPAACPTCKPADPTYLPSGNLVATGAAVYGLVIAALVLIAVGAVLLWAARKAGSKHNK